MRIGRLRGREGGELCPCVLGEEEGGRRKEDGGRRKEEGGRRKEEGIRNVPSV